jgi:hypothetical protein
MPKKSHPVHVDATNPSPNFVEMCYRNHGDKEGYYDMMYGGPDKFTSEPRKASGYGHGIGQRAGKLRLSGRSNAHRIGKR